MFKRLFDFTAASLGLILLAPFFLLIALAIRLDSPGPVFYKATRVGKGGRLFGMYKFRTMQDGPGGNGPRVTAQDDPRITRIGRVLRRTKLNELPQLLNVLIGDMSLVGPRPEDPEFVAHYSPEEREVLSVKPGITSPAAIIYFDEEARLNHDTAARTYLSEIMPTKLRLDLLYVRNRSFLLDLDVLFHTFLALIPLLRRAAPEVEEIVFGPLQRLVRRYISWFVLDWATAFFAVAAAGLVWRTAGPFDLGWKLALLAAFGLAFVFTLVNSLTGVQKVVWRYASLGEAVGIAISTMFTTALLLVGNAVLPVRWARPLFPAGMLLLTGLLALAGFGIIRYRSRLVIVAANRWSRLTGSPGGEREKAIVVGGGEAAQMALLWLQQAPARRAFHVVGIVDDDLWKRGARIRGASVLGSCRHIPTLVKDYDVGLLVFSIHNIRPAEREAILEICRSTPARVAILPNFQAIMTGLEGTSDSMAQAPARGAVGENGQRASDPLSQPVSSSAQK